MSQPAKRQKTIRSFFKQKDTSKIANEQGPGQSPSQEGDAQIPSQEVHEQHPSEEVEAHIPPQEVHGEQPINFDIACFERDPGLRPAIYQYGVNVHDDVRRAYIKAGPYQPILQRYPASRLGGQNRRFQASWFMKFPWLEYSPSTDSVYCFPCFLFETDPPKRPAFTFEGFKNWKRVNNGRKCAFLHHVGGHRSPHLEALDKQANLATPSEHIDYKVVSQTDGVVEKNRLRLEVMIQTVRWLAYQACAFRGHDESENSENPGNFLRLIQYAAYWNENVKGVIENCPINGQYIAPSIQREILHILANNVKKKICEDIGNHKFCILVDEAQDEAHVEQMAIILRFVDKNGILRERFFGVVGVADTTALTLKTQIDNVLAHYNLDTGNMRGQGYDGASNMRGAWKGLQALFLQDCPYAYYVHCFAHRLQLTLIAACNEIHDIWLFFSMLNTIVGLITTSSKRHNELHSAQALDIAKKLAAAEYETGKGANQIGNLQRAGAIRWSSHFASVSSLIHMFDSTYEVLESIIVNGASAALRGQARGASKQMKSFEFVFILHLMNSVMGITDVLCQAIQQKSQDIVNTMNLVSSTRKLLQELRQNGWNTFFERVKSFCEKHEIISVPDMSARYMEGIGRSCQQQDHITLEHHYHFDIFHEAIDKQEKELEARFNEGTMKLLTLSSALDPRDKFKAFKIDDICRLAEEFYPEDFTEQELIVLRSQLQHYNIDVPYHLEFEKVHTMVELCEKLVETMKSEIYYLIDRLIRLVLTLPVSTATIERAFSAMKLIKTQLRNNMGEELLSDCMIVYIERELSVDINPNSIIDEFDCLKRRNTKLHHH